MNKKQIGALSVGAVLVGAGGIATGFGLDKETVCDNTDLLDKISLLEGNFSDLEASYSELLLTNTELKVELLSYDSVIKEVKAEEVAEVFAWSEVLDDTRDLEDFLESEFGWDIGDDDNIELSDYYDVEFIESDYDDEKYVIKFEDVRVDYEDDDNEYSERINISVIVEEGEIERIDYVEA
jgi:hypothetical protein